MTCASWMDIFFVCVCENNNLDDMLCKSNILVTYCNSQCCHSAVCSDVIWFDINILHSAVYGSFTFSRQLRLLWSVAVVANASFRLYHTPTYKDQCCLFGFFSTCTFVSRKYPDLWWPTCLVLVLFPLLWIYAEAHVFCFVLVVNMFPGMLNNMCSFLLFACFQLMSRCLIFFFFNYCYFFCISDYFFKLLFRAPEIIHVKENVFSPQLRRERERLWFRVPMWMRKDFIDSRNRDGGGESII